MVRNRKRIPTIQELADLFGRENYLADSSTLIAVYLALTLERPLLIEGEPGCGKTELAKALARILHTELIRLQCYEGLDANSTLYEWNYAKQLLAIKIRERRSSSSKKVESEIFSERFLLERPLLKATIYSGRTAPVLLIDEIDRADEEFEGLLLEFLAEFQITIPELGTFRAKHRPVVILTSNRTRDLGDGLRRRCLYLYVTYPSPQREFAIVRMKIPGAEEALAKQVIEAVSRLRRMDDMMKKPGIAETLDWILALLALGRRNLDRQTLEETLGCVVKDSDELLRLKSEGLDALAPIK